MEVVWRAAAFCLVPTLSFSPKPRLPPQGFVHDQEKLVTRTSYTSYRPSAA